MSLSLAAVAGFARDMRHALRAMRARPGFSAAIVVTLALGIGATTAIFSVVNGVLLRPLAFPHESRLVTLCEQYPGASGDWCSISPPNVMDIAARSRTIEHVGIARAWSAHMASPGGAAYVNAGIATPDVFRALGVGVERGRMIDSTDLLGRESDVALLTHEMWQARFGGDPGIVGRVVQLDGHAVQVVGVLPPGFHVPLYETVEMWRPLHIDPRDERNREWRGFVAYGILREGASRADARADLARVVASLKAGHFAATPAWGVTMMPARDLVVRGVRPMLRLFLAAVALVLLVACANVGNLLLAHGATRGREMALRSALGAGSARIARVLLAESAAYAALGAGGGLALAVGGVAAFRALAPAGMPRVDGVRVDWVVAAFAAGL
ncbi:MAG TPA: ABC transporter permease, partial [Gemmatimonadaceae bacterium]|nr:ABC transporter permease [Gemmatimonadaceae bacterium]